MFNPLTVAIIALCLSASVTGTLDTNPEVGAPAGRNGENLNSNLGQYTREIHDQCENIRILPLRRIQNIPPAPGRPDNRFTFKDDGFNGTGFQPRPTPPARLIAHCGPPNRRRLTELRLDQCLGWDTAGERLVAQQKYRHPVSLRCPVKANECSGGGIQRGGCWGCKYHTVTRDQFRIACFCDNVTHGFVRVIHGTDRMAAKKSFTEGKGSLNFPCVQPH
ncbi:hypothetical protein BDV26DRAFT_296489 [Aspergillus bertholletiae]|uniref:Cyanovirin-N domain-containing protein n=1 Tax=Aspergillus bertholletiae TaxID=1226010 RepID=A0A5N7AX76_9EURO|nr:hypothetical protein BDV26DRAFT_296489 [Aspergillus bertholletiae]